MFVGVGWCSCFLLFWSLFFMVKNIRVYGFMLLEKINFNIDGGEGGVVVSILLKGLVFIGIEDGFV